MKIPQRIIQTGKTRELSPLAKASAANLRLLHPEWEYVYFDDAAIRQFVAREFPEYQEVFDAFPRTIQRIDFFRYLAIHRLGGFYFDLDVMLSERLDSLLEHSCVFPFEELTLNRFLRERYELDWEIGNYAFGAAPGDPFLEAVIENCVRAQRDPQWVKPAMDNIPRLFRPEFEVLNTTGPGLLSRTMAENRNAAAAMTVLFSGDVREPAHWHQFGHYGVHLMEGSWRANGNLLYRRLFWWWEAREKKRLMASSQQLGPTRSVPAANVPSPEEGGLVQA